MRELNDNEVESVSGGLVPLVFAIIGIDLALNGVLIGYAAWASSNYSR
jgi:lactobin A/cerein 7B family class IIb bacteriocin